MGSFKKYGQLKIPIVLVAIGIFITVYLFSKKDAELPIFGPRDFNPDLVDADLQDTETPHTVSDFKLTNQNGEIITQADYENKVYVADFFFTRCPSICPIMSINMATLQQAFLDDDNVMFLSVSVTPEMDSVPVLKDYAYRNGVIDSKWHVTTGNKKHIYNLARKSYFAALDEGDGGLQDFIHTPNFVLVDKKKQIRGVYDGTKNDDVLQLIDDIKKLSD